MIQTHLMKLEAPYPVLNIDGTLVRHIATLIEVREIYDRQSGEERIKTVSHPVVDYGDGDYAGVVYDDKNIEDYEPLPRVLRGYSFSVLMYNIQRHNLSHIPFWKPEFLVPRLKELGIDVEWPTKKDADGFDTDEPEDHFDTNIAIGHTEEGWWVESYEVFLDFHGFGFKSEHDLLDYIRDLRSSYYKAFSDRQFDIVFNSNKPEAQKIVAELNANPHL